MLENSILPPGEINELKLLDEVLANYIINDYSPADRLQNLFDIDQVSAELLEPLANLFGVVGWQTSWSETQKRDYLKLSLKLQEKAGTKWALQKILDIFKPGSLVQEWYETKPNSKPGFLKLNLGSSFLPGEEKILRRLLDYYKNQKTSYKIDVIAGTATGNILLFGNLFIWQVKFKEFSPSTRTPEFHLKLGGAVFKYPSFKFNF